MKTKTEKIIDGRFQSGILLDWAEHQNMELMERVVYMQVVYSCCQRFHKRNSNISLESFGLNKNTVSKYRKTLTEKGYIRWKRTKAYTAYELLEPKEWLDKFSFSSHSSDTVKKNKSDKELEELKIRLFA